MQAGRPCSRPRDYAHPSSEPRPEAVAEKIGAWRDWQRTLALCLTILPFSPKTRYTASGFTPILYEDLMPENVNTIKSAHSETENILLAIWKDVLKNDTCRVDDDFLSLGGDSLSAMLCISRVRKAMGVELDLVDFFLEPATISRFVSIIDGKRR